MLYPVIGAPFIFRYDDFIETPITARVQLDDIAGCRLTAFARMLVKANPRDRHLAGKSKFILNRHDTSDANR